MATFDEIQDIPNLPDVYLIDVRNSEEVNTSGLIPHSIHIPLSDLKAALEMEAKAFEAAYNRPKPAGDSVIIFSCYSGGRAQTATDLALHMGYKNAKFYPGSWREWSRVHGLT